MKASFILEQSPSTPIDALKHQKLSLSQIASAGEIDDNVDMHIKERNGGSLNICEGNEIQCLYDMSLQNL